MPLRYWMALSSDLHDEVLGLRDAWSRLLADESNSEHAYQQFLATNAGFFFADCIWCVVVLSQIRLGSQHVTDFVLGRERGSPGFEYELIEIETPHEPAYNRSGRPSARLNAALEQVADWQQWIAANTNEAKRLFPSADFLFQNAPNFTYTVVIGRRTSDDDQRIRRNRRAKQLGVSVRSFDWLTDRLMRRPFFNTFESHAPECSRLPVETRNQLASPFNVAIPHAPWSALVTSSAFSPHHSVPLNASGFIRTWQQSDRLAQFDAAWAALPDDRREAFAREMVEIERAAARRAV